MQTIYLDVLLLQKASMSTIFCCVLRHVSRIRRCGLPDACWFRREAACFPC